MLKCKVCNTRNKNVVLSRCYHTFCKECINANLEARQRKCPTCRHKITHDDVNQLYWE